jgi:hypothetical protein
MEGEKCEEPTTNDNEQRQNLVGGATTEACLLHLRVIALATATATAEHGRTLSALLAPLQS